MKASLQENGLKYTLFGVSVLALGVAADAAPARSATLQAGKSALQRAIADRSRSLLPRGSHRLPIRPNRMRAPAAGRGGFGGGGAAGRIRVVRARSQNGEALRRIRTLDPNLGKGMPRRAPISASA